MKPWYYTIIGEPEFGHDKEGIMDWIDYAFVTMALAVMIMAPLTVMP